MGEILKAEVDDVKEFKNIITASEQVLTEIKFEADSEGIRFRGLDGGHTCFFEVIFDEGYFLNYEIDEPETIIVDTGELLKIIKRVRNTDDLRIIIDNFNLIIEAGNDKIDKSFKINGIDMEYDAPSMPNIPFPVQTSVGFDELKDSIGDVELYSDIFTLQSKDGMVQLVTNSVIGEYASKLRADDELRECKSRFSTELLKKFFKLTGITDTLIFKMGDNIPLMMSISLGDLKINYMIAPRIEEE